MWGLREWGCGGDRGWHEAKKDNTWLCTEFLGWLGSAGRWPRQSKKVQRDGTPGWREEVSFIVSYCRRRAKWIDRRFRIETVPRV